jgi:hypothetical protein
VTDPADVRALVRRDLQVAGGGVAAAVVAWLLFALSGLGVLGDRGAATAIIVISMIAAFVCFVWWLGGPRQLRRDRTLVLAPIFIIALPALISLDRLGGGLAVVLVSSLVGFSAAVAAGLALASRRAR